jgi:uncharacterized membrane protein YhaH (DUF805 family)
MRWYLKAVKDNYANFSGRAQRAEYWYFTLFNVIFAFCFGFIDGLFGLSLASDANGDSLLGLLGTIYWLALLIPGISVSARRLHDVGRSGWWLLLMFTCIGIIPLTIWACIDSTPGENQYGPNPKGIPQASGLRGPYTAPAAEGETGKAESEETDEEA